MIKWRHAQRYVLPPDKRFEVPLKSTNSLAPFFNPLRNLGGELWMEEDGTNHLVTVKLRNKQLKAIRQNRIFNTLCY